MRKKPISSQDFLSHGQIGECKSFHLCNMKNAKKVAFSYECENCKHLKMSSKYGAWVLFASRSVALLRHLLKWFWLFTLWLSVYTEPVALRCNSTAKRNVMSYANVDHAKTSWWMYSIHIEIESNMCKKVNSIEWHWQWTRHSHFECSTYIVETKKNS